MLFKLIPTGLWVLSMKWVWMMLNKSSKLAYEVRTLTLYLISKASPNNAGLKKFYETMVSLRKYYPPYFYTCCFLSIIFWVVDLFKRYL